jgi:hypothetical protein
MNVLYTVSFPADRERVDRVRSSIEQCLDASALDPSTHDELARATASLLALASGWADGPDAMLAVHIEATAGVHEVTVHATRGGGATCALSARFAPRGVHSAG